MENDGIAVHDSDQLPTTSNDTLEVNFVDVDSIVRVEEIKVEPDLDNHLAGQYSKKQALKNA